MPYVDSLDIGNRMMQICEQTQIVSVTEDSKNNLEASFAYDKIRRAELQRNVWTFATKKVALRAIDTTTMILQPALWDATVTYTPGAIVSDVNGGFWISVEENNFNNEPNVGNDKWVAYFGPRTISLYDTTGTTAYYAGELVYAQDSYPGSYSIFMSLIQGNTDVPNVATVWDTTATYNGSATVSYGGSQWRSLIDFNKGITPADGPLPFDIGAIYSSSQTVTGSDNFIYSSIGNGNVGHDPTTDAGVHWTNTGVANAWSRSPTVAVSAATWRKISATMTNLVLPYPIGSGPSSQSFTRNVFRKPCGYLRIAPQDPKAGSVSIFGAPTGLMYNDWEFEGDYIVSMTPTILLLRFVADVTKVTEMNDMFCEGLALRGALAVIGTFTQDASKKREVAGEYQKMMSEARLVNAIEKGAEQPPEDDWITTRL